MSGWRILIADDDEAMRAWLRLALRTVTSEIEDAGSGQELLERIATDDVRFDAVVTDVRMPGPDGLQVVVMARTAGLNTPILVITAFPDRSLAETVARLDHTALLAKPFDVVELRAALRALID